jgi:hypothetical protein
MRAAPAHAAPARAAVRATPVQAGPPPAVAPTAVLSARFARSFDIAVVVVVAGWHIAGAGSELFPYRGLYRSFPVQFALWLVIALAIAAGALRLLGGRSRPAWSYALAAAALAVTVAGAVGCPAGQLLRIDWAWGTAGWVGLLVLLRRPVR